MQNESSLAKKLDGLVQIIADMWKAGIDVELAVHEYDDLLGNTLLPVSKRKVDQLYESGRQMWELTLAVVWETAQPRAQAILLETARSLFDTYRGTFAATSFYGSGLDPAALEARLATAPSDAEGWISLVFDLSYLLTDVDLDQLPEVRYALFYDLWRALPAEMKYLPAAGASSSSPG